MKRLNVGTFGSMLAGLALALLVATASQAKSAKSGAALTNAILDEVRRSFTVEGKRIPPEIFRDFGDGNLADPLSMRVTIDVRATIGSNLYADDIEENGAWVTQRRADKSVMNGYEETGYRFIGTTANKLLVAIGAYNGGGSGTFHTLHFLELAPAKAFDPDGAVYDRINLTILRSIALGDRWDGEVKIAGDTVIVTTNRKGPVDKSAPTTTRFEARRP